MFEEKYLPIIMQEVEQIHKTYNLNANASIGDYIFAILKNECILLEWPEDKQLDLDGLYQTCQGTKAGRKIIFIKPLLECVVKLMDFYYVPYKAVSLRLRETGVVSDRITEALLGFEETDEGKNIIDEIIRQQGITRLRTPDRKIQYSIQLENLRTIVKDPSITKYMTTDELTRYLGIMGFVAEDIKLIEEMKKIETETIELDESK